MVLLIPYLDFAAIVLSKCATSCLVSASTSAVELLAASICELLVVSRYRNKFVPHKDALH